MNTPPRCWGLIFLKFADNEYAAEDAIIKEHAKLKGTRRKKTISDIAIEKCGFYLPGRRTWDLSKINFAGKGKRRGYAGPGPLRVIPSSKL
ncbi:MULTISPECIES: hypothetical protein [unclassified Microbulbifer]|uniref:hypothetical protein n=1 Tax=unclassified Microbulbifer TaxID=2619833 RepID=UPI0027E4DDCE|nr:MULTISPECIES: hypothetical protein [unclassified Microbulbifer]